MALKVKEFDLNKFWQQTPNVLKYFLIIAIIVALSYFVITRTIDKGQLKELDKIEQNITVTYGLVNKFEAFQKTQASYNEQVINDLNKIYSLINELNSNTNRKFDMVLKNSNNKELLEKLQLLNESFEKLSKAYQPEEKKTEVINTTSEIKINVRPIKSRTDTSKIKN